MGNSVGLAVVIKSRRLPLNLWSLFCRNLGLTTVNYVKNTALLLDAGKKKTQKTDPN